MTHRLFFAVATLLFLASTAATIAWCGSMSAMGGMPMPGGWTMSMAWMRMPGQTWSAAAATFLGMWLVMMVAMMLPSHVPMLWRYRDAAGRRGATRLDLRTALAAAGYFCVWLACGAVIFPAGVALATAAMRWPSLARAVPFVIAITILLAGALQFSAWKARHLACCRELPHRDTPLPSTTRAAWRYGARLGMHCIDSSAGLTATLLALGVMDLRVMAIVTAAITAERLAPARARIAEIIGVIGIAAGVSLLVFRLL